MPAQNRTTSSASKAPVSRSKAASPRKNTRTPIVVVRGSRIHGKGVFATRRIAKGERIIEYKGRLITEAEADALYGDDESNHTFLFLLDNDMVIDAYRNGNSARWINHSCDPNCEPMEEGNRLYIHAISEIAPGEELSYEYNLVIEDRYTPAVKRLYACRCGSRKCRGTFLAER